MRYAHNPILSPEDLCPSQPSDADRMPAESRCILLRREGLDAGQGRRTPCTGRRGDQLPGARRAEPRDGDACPGRLPRTRPLGCRGSSITRAEDFLTTMSHLRLVSSTDGIRFREEAGYPPLTGSDRYEAYGIEDCRVTQIGTQYYLTYTAVSANGVAVRCAARRTGAVSPITGWCCRRTIRTARSSTRRSVTYIICCTARAAPRSAGIISGSPRAPTSAIGETTGVWPVPARGCGTAPA